MESNNNGLASGLGDYLRHMFTGDFKGEVTLREIPSVRKGNQYVRAIIGDEQDPANQKRYIAKAWVCRDADGTLQLLRTKSGKNPALFEAELIENIYLKNGARVPSIPHEYPPTKNVLVMTDLGDSSPEKLFSDPTLSQSDAEGLAVKVAKELINFHRIGNAHQDELIDTAPPGLIKPMYAKRAREYRRILAATETELREELQGERRKKEEWYKKEFDDLMEVVVRNISGAGAQLIHGDMTDYHLRMQPNGEVYVIDLGSPRFSTPRCVDLSDFLFSPGVPLSLEAKTRVFEGYTRENTLAGAGIRGFLLSPTKEYLAQEEKRFLFVTLLGALRRSARSKEARVENPEEFSKFAGQHPAYANPIPHYLKTTKDITKHLLDNQRKYKLSEGDAKILDKSHLLLISLIARGKPERQLDPDELEEIARICHHLPGLRRRLPPPRQPRVTCETRPAALTESERQAEEGRRMAEKEEGIVNTDNSGG